MGRALRSKPLRNALWMEADGKCRRCGCALPDDWHADHINAWVYTERTNVHEMQALCPSCNLKKGASVELRTHQGEALDLVRDTVLRGGRSGRQWSFNVFPGGGKSALPVIFGAELKKAGLIDKICIVVPRLALRKQNADEFLKPRWRQFLGHRLALNEAGNDVNPSRGTDGYVTTYQALASDAAGLHAAEFKRHRYLLCLDEVHHCGEQNEWTVGVRPLVAASAFRVFMTGTPDKHEGGRISFLEYSQPELGGKMFPDMDVTYDLKQATAQRAVIKLVFPHVDGEIKYLDTMGREVTETTLTGDDESVREKIWVAINTDYAKQLVAKCVASWKSFRAQNQRSRMLVVCASIAQAKNIAKYINDQLGVTAAVAVSDEDKSQTVIANFRNDLTPDVLVTVMMAYEGLDVPALTHLACLTQIRSFPWLMQMFGRVMRFDPDAGPWERQRAFAFVPDDTLMQRAVEYIRDGQMLGVDADDGRERKSRERQDQSGDNEPSASVVPLVGRATRERTVTLDDGEDVGYRETAQIQTLMDECGIIGSVADAKKFLRLVESKARPSDNTPSPSQDVSPKQKLTALRSTIQSSLGRIDQAKGYPFGTMNKVAMNEAQKAARERT